MFRFAGVRSVSQVRSFIGTRKVWKENLKTAVKKSPLFIVFAGTFDLLRNGFLYRLAQNLQALFRKKCALHRDSTVNRESICYLVGHDQLDQIKE